MSFYAVPLSKCPCGKPATHQVYTSGTQSYGRYCKKCADKRVKEGNKYLEKTGRHS